MAATKTALPPDPEPIAANPAGDPDDFFAVSSKERESEMKNFIKELGRPKEKMEDVEMDFMEDPEEGPEAAGEGMSDQEREMAGYFDTSDGHKEMARVGLLAIDKFLAFLASLFTGMDMDRYKRSKKPDEYEIEVTAAMIKKYQVHMSLEWMFIMAIIGAYSPTFQRAYADRKAMKAAQEKQRRQEELEALARNIRNP